MSTKQKLKAFVDHPIAWIVGVVSSITAVVFSVGLDPFGAGIAAASVFVGNAMNIFTASSITAFTLAPMIDWIPQGTFEYVAIAAGLVVVGKLLFLVGGKLKEQVVED